MRRPRAVLAGSLVVVGAAALSVGLPAIPALANTPTITITGCKSILVTAKDYTGSKNHLLLVVDNVTIKDEDFNGEDRAIWSNPDKTVAHTYHAAVTGQGGQRSDDKAGTIEACEKPATTTTQPSTTTTAPDVTTTTEPAATTTTAPDDTTTTEPAPASTVPGPTHRVFDICGQVRIVLTGYQPGDSLSVSNDIETNVVLVDRTGNIDVTYLSTSHWHVIVTATVGAFDSGIVESKCAPSTAPTVPATPVIHDDTTTTTVTPVPVVPPGGPAAPAAATSLPATGSNTGPTLGIAAGLVLAGVGVVRLMGRKGRRTRTA